VKGVGSGEERPTPVAKIPHKAMNVNYFLDVPAHRLAESLPLEGAMRLDIPAALCVLLGKRASQNSALCFQPVGLTWGMIERSPNSRSNGLPLDL